MLRHTAAMPGGGSDLKDTTPAVRASADACHRSRRREQSRPLPQRRAMARVKVRVRPVTMHVTLGALAADAASEPTVSDAGLGGTGRPREDVDERA